MSARLVIVLFAALAIFASVQADSCSSSSKGNLKGILRQKDATMAKGQNSITFDLNRASTNPCGNTGNTNGLAIKVCVPAGSAGIQIDDNTAVVSRTNSASSVTVELDFYCRK